MSEPVIEARRLTKTFGEGACAVDRLDLAVPRGAVYGLLGRNGAGKTTLIRLLMGLLRPTEGETRILGEPLTAAARQVRARVAYVCQSQKLHEWMTLEELGRYLSHFYPRWDASHARELARRWDLVWDRPVGTLSGGDQRRAASLLALAARPEVLVLDEPAAGLDPLSRRQLIDELIDALGRESGCTVLFSTHIISDLERIADQVGLMDRGRLILSSPLEALKETTQRVQAVFEGEAPPPGFTLPGTVRSQTAGPVVNAVVRLPSQDAFETLRRIPGARVQIFPLGLEEIFIELLGPEARSELTEVHT